MPLTGPSHTTRLQPRRVGPSKLRGPSSSCQRPQGSEKPVKWMTQRFGHRGVWLIIIGAVYFAFGLGLLLEPERPAPGAFHQMLPLPLRAALWMGSAAIAIFVGLKGRGGDDSWGHMALWVMPAERLLSFGGAWLLYVISAISPIDDNIGYANGWYAALIWLFIVVMLRLVAAWPNPSEVPLPPADEVVR